MKRCVDTWCSCNVLIAVPALARTGLIGGVQTNEAVSSEEDAEGGMAQLDCDDWLDPDKRT